MLNSIQAAQLKSALEATISYKAIYLRCLLLRIEQAIQEESQTLLGAVGGQLEGEHGVPMLQFLDRLHGLAELYLILKEQHLGRLLPTLRITKV